MNRNTLDEAVADPMIGAVLHADHIDPHGFEIMTRTVARLEGWRRRAAQPAASAFARMDVAAW